MLCLLCAGFSPTRPSGGRKKRGRKNKTKNIFNNAIYWKKKGKDKSRNLFKFVLGLLSASVERVGVSRMRDFFLNYLNFPEFTWMYMILPKLNLHKITLFTWINLHLHKHNWIYLNLPEITYICLNLLDFTLIYWNLRKLTKKLSKYII